MAEAFMMRYLGKAMQGGETENSTTVSGSFTSGSYSKVIPDLIGKKRFIIHLEDDTSLRTAGAVNVGEDDEVRYLLAFIYLDGVATTLYISDRNYDENTKIQKVTDGFVFDESTGKIESSSTDPDTLRYRLGSSSAITYRYQSFD